MSLFFYIIPSICHSFEPLDFWKNFLHIFVTLLPVYTQVYLRNISIYAILRLHLWNNIKLFLLISLACRRNIPHKSLSILIPYTISLYLHSFITRYIPFSFATHLWVGFYFPEGSQPQNLLEMLVFGCLITRSYPVCCHFRSLCYVNTWPHFHISDAILIRFTLKTESVLKRRWSIFYRYYHSFACGHLYIAFSPRILHVGSISFR